MKTLKLFPILLFIFFSQNTFAQDEGRAKLANCQRFTILLLQGDNSVQKNLTDCLVNMAVFDSSLVTEYNNWMTNVSSQTQENLQAQLNNLEAQKQQATQEKNQSFGALMNNINSQATSMSQQPSASKTSATEVSKCVNRPGYGCGQQ